MHCVSLDIYIVYISSSMVFLKMQPGTVSNACAPFLATSKTAVIANCPDFKQMHNIRTTIKLGPSSQSHRDQE